MQGNKAEVMPVPAVGAVIIEEGAILLVMRKFDPSRGKWSIPGGRVEAGETLAEALRREVLEETGLLVEPGGVAGVYDIIDKVDDVLRFHYVVVDYFAYVVGGILKAGDDALEVRWVPVNKLSEYSLADHLGERLHQLTGG